MNAAHHTHWACPKCSATYVSERPLAAVAHSCPANNGRMVDYRPTAPTAVTP